MVFCVKKKKNWLMTRSRMRAAEKELGALSQKILSAKSRAAQLGRRQGEDLAHYP